MQLPRWIRRFFGGTPRQAPPKPKMVIPLDNVRQLAGGRASIDKATDILSRFPVIEAPPAPDLSWRILNLDDRTLSRISPTRLMELLVDLSPEVSKGLWDALRLLNPGWEAAATNPTTGDPDDTAQQALDTFIDELHDLHGSFDVVLNRLSIGGVLRGALFSELVLSEDGTMPVDLVVPDPASVRFRKIPDPERGKRWQLGQFQGSDFVPLEQETIRYVPIDPLPGGAPYGRPIMAPALFASLFLLGILHDLRRVVSQQGYPRLDIEVDLETLSEQMPDDILSDIKKWQEWVNAIIEEIEDVYAELEPDDAYVHTSTIRVNRPVGTVDADSLGAIDGIIEALERMLTRAMKSVPTFMGTRQSTTETQSNREWELMIAGISALQHLAENMLERLLGLALEAQGIQASVTFRFAKLREAERTRDAQARRAEIQNEALLYALGLISQDEMAETLVGHEPDVDAPRIALPSPLEDVLSRVTQPPVGSQSTEWLAELRETRREVARALWGLNGRKEPSA